MFTRLVLPACLAVALAAPAWAKPITPDEVTRCLTPEPTREQTDAAQAAIDNYRNVLHGLPRVGTINVAFHVITCRGEGNVTDAQIDAQIRELNHAYLNTGFTFRLASVDRTENCLWFGGLTSPGIETKAKQALAIDPAHRLNVYSAKLGHYLLGWAYFPQSFPEDYFMHGVVLHYGSLPGGYLAPYNLGGTLDHEAGHYLGLYHTFQGGCVEPGDYCEDTPFEASPAFGCPIGRNTCPQPGDDPIHNYMDYTIDECYTEFTVDQAERMQYIVALYRPSLVGGSSLAFDPGAGTSLAARAPVAGGVTFRGAFPNPFSRETTLRFALAKEGAVSLRLYNVAGQLVKTLVDGRLGAGEQAVSLQAGTLPPGMYFATLRHDGGSATRSVVLIP